jgi:4-diphosphocytidyl-2-C-methyl-D-erythritol kinase
VDEISLKAPAKINLYLRVLGKREDGYHEIESLVQAIDLYDEIVIEKSDLMELDCDDPSLPSDEGNLASKAAFLLQQRSYFPGAKISLKKNIPVGAGLGGGSSDAAFVIRGICELYNMDLSTGEILDIAAKVGSDVPFFLTTGQAVITGRGEKVKSVRLPTDYKIALIVPPRANSTAEIYGKLKKDLTKKHDPILLKREIPSSSFYRLMSSFVNDLEEAVLVDWPELAKLKELLISSGCIYSLMTGSGSAVFGVYLSTRIEKSQLELQIGREYRLAYCAPILLPPFQ